MTLSRSKQFFITFAVFAVLGVAFKVMVLVDGFTEVRPVNAIPPVAGLAFGPLGGIACGLGNLFADVFGSWSWNWSSVLGLTANFVAAFLPYRLWHLFSKEMPNVHSHKNMLRFVLICLVSAFTVAWMLAFGLYTFFGIWVKQIYTYVFLNNFAFSIMFGLPLLIVLTSDSVAIVCQKPIKHAVFGKFRAWKAPVCAAYVLLMLVIFVCVFFLDMNPQGAPWMHILSALSLLGLLCQLV